MLTEAVRQRIIEIVETYAPEAFIVDMHLHKGGKSVLAVKVDTDKGISLDTCAKLSRKIGFELEDEPSMNFPYNLEVSSPGIGYPLKLHRQYVQNIGRFVAVNMQDEKTYQGKILKVDNETLTLEPVSPRKKGKSAPKKKKPADDDPRLTPEGLLVVRFDEVEEAKVIIIF